MIVRVSKASRERFVILDITAARDPRLSWGALGVHTYLMTMADGWEVRIPQLLEFRDSAGRDALRSIFRELEAYGYAELRRKMDGAKIVGSEWIIFEKPGIPDELPGDGFSGDRDSRPPEKASAENPSPFKKDQQSKKDQSSKEEQKCALPGDELFSLGLSAQPKEEQAEAIYQAYPRRIAKKPGLKAITAALKKIHFDELLGRVQSFANECRRSRVPVDRIPYPATWFNAERWVEHTRHTTHDPNDDEPWLRPPGADNGKP